MTSTDDIIKQTNSAKVLRENISKMVSSMSQEERKLLINILMNAEPILHKSEDKNEYWLLRQG